MESLNQLLLWEVLDLLHDDKLEIFMIAYNTHYELMNEYRIHLYLTKLDVFVNQSSAFRDNIYERLLVELSTYNIVITKNGEDYSSARIRLHVSDDYIWSVAILKNGWFNKDEMLHIEIMKPNGGIQKFQDVDTLIVYFVKKLS